MTGTWGKRTLACPCGYVLLFSPWLSLNTYTLGGKITGLSLRVKAPLSPWGYWEGHWERLFSCFCNKLSSAKNDLEILAQMWLCPYLSFHLKNMNQKNLSGLLYYEQRNSENYEPIHRCQNLSQEANWFSRDDQLMTSSINICSFMHMSKAKLTCFDFLSRSP